MKERQIETFARKPLWLRRGLPTAPVHDRLRSFLDSGRLHTVCREARCPNREECFSRGTATFLILGDTCTRRCRFCAVHQGEPSLPDPDEPRRIAEAAMQISLEYVVVTSVTRDDLDDGGAGAFAETIRALRVRRPGIRIEVLIPDFRGDETALRTVLDARPDVLSHNLETVKRLYPEVRPGAVYDRSLELLDRVRRCAPDVTVKSGMMLGLGERPDELETALKDLIAAGCRNLTLGQYLQPRKECLPVACFIPPEAFNAWRKSSLGMGFQRVSAGPLVRSSYHAEALDARR
jgi:lipoic acid synthetase